MPDTTPRPVGEMTRVEVLAELNRFNPFGGYNTPRFWAKVSTPVLQATLLRYREGRPPSQEGR